MLRGGGEAAAPADSRRGGDSRESPIALLLLTA